MTSPLKENYMINTNIRKVSQKTLKQKKTGGMDMIFAL
jgi:hypothetical protein